MRPPQYLFIVLLLATAACGHPSLTLVPEVSPPLHQEEVFALTGQAAGNILFSCAAGIGWVEAAGRIATWDPEKKAAGTVQRLPFRVSEPPFCQNGFLALHDPAARQLAVFDLARMENRFVDKDSTARRVLGVDGEHVVYLDGENLVVHHWPAPPAIHRQPAGDQDFFNCHFLPDRILIMGSRSMFVFWKKNGKFQLGPLPLPATGPCVYHRENIYYGSSQRQLVKVSLPDTRLEWKIKLGHDLKRQPLFLAGTLLVSPEDNSVLQFNRRGSVRWWLGLDSILQYELVPLANQLAAFLLNNEIKFIDVRRRATTVFRINGRPAGAPLAFKNELYFLTADGKTQKLQRVGNRYGIEVERMPKQALLPWAPITFSLQTSNLLKPRLRCEIRDEAGQVLLVKTFSPSVRARLVWLPKQAGAYRLHVKAAALNRNEETELAFLVFDPRRIILYFQLFL